METRQSPGGRVTMVEHEKVINNKPRVKKVVEVSIIHIRRIIFHDWSCMLLTFYGINVFLAVRFELLSYNMAQFTPHLAWKLFRGSSVASALSLQPWSPLNRMAKCPYNLQKRYINTRIWSKTFFTCDAYAPQCFLLISPASVNVWYLSLPVHVLLSVPVFLSVHTFPMSLSVHVFLMSLSVHVFPNNHRYLNLR